ncbi:MAG TPA: diguanylate cyclase [Aquimonas sp.]|nr:diguanylate cyclase [Aquimonas sp.]
MSLPILRLLRPLWLLCLVVAGGTAFATEYPLIAEVRSTGQTAQAMAVDEDHKAVSQQHPVAEYALRTTHDQWPTGPLVLLVNDSGMQWLTLQMPSGKLSRTRMLNRHPAAEIGYGDVAWLLDGVPAPGESIRLTVDATDVTPAPIRIRLVDLTSYLRDNGLWMAYVSACLAVMAAMALIALVFALFLRDLTFVWYSVYLIAYGWILAMQTGFLAAPLGLSFASQGAPPSGRIALLLAVTSAVLFLDRFANLSRYAPKLRRLLMVFALAMVVAALLGLVPLAELRAFGRALVNPLLVLGGPLLLIVALRAGLRGSRYAWVFLLGWTPLLVATVLSSLQGAGLALGWHWWDEVQLAAGAFEALVLSIGLAQRAADTRKAHAQALRLAEVDPLTGLFNRRGWDNRLAELESHGQTASMAVIFLDIDHFKHLNDERGHAAGDQILQILAGLMREELRDLDVLARMGGEELVAALPGCSIRIAHFIAERLRQRIEERFATDAVLSGVSYPVTASFGVAQRLHAEPLAALMRRADLAMYAAKAQGRNRVVAAEE